jgi:hypothetical protein
VQCSVVACGSGFGVTCSEQTEGACCLLRSSVPVSYAFQTWRETVWKRAVLFFWKMALCNRLPTLKASGSFEKLGTDYTASYPTRVEFSTTPTSEKKTVLCLKVVRLRPDVVLLRVLLRLVNEYGAQVEWYWQGKLKYWEDNFSQCYFVHHKSHADLSRIEAGSLRLAIPENT